MKKTLEYLHQIYKSIKSSEINSKIALIGEKLHIAEEGWNFYFKLSIDDSMNRVNENVIIGILVNLASVTDIIHKGWSSKTISYKKGGKLELICLLRNHFVHGGSAFHLPMWSANENGLTNISFVHITDIHMIRGLNEWKDKFENNNADDWWSESWAENSKNQIIQDAMDLHKDDLEKIDNELLEMVSTYFNRILK